MILLKLVHDENVNLVNGSRKSSQKSEATNGSGSQEDEGNNVVKGDVVGQSTPPRTPPQKQQAGILKKSSPVNYKSSKL